ncbi:MAG: hypothetical protein H6R10_3218 [Rhodocyclaceae bacterium]|nr:hypothetical protein [Rhodocyclaceae bacterium]
MFLPPTLHYAVGENLVILMGGEMRHAQKAAFMLVLSMAGAAPAFATDDLADAGPFLAGGSVLGFSGSPYALTPVGGYGLSPRSVIGVKAPRKGIDIAPYFAHRLGDNYSVDAAAVVVPAPGVRLAGSRMGIGKDGGDGERRFAGFNLNSGRWFGNVQVAGRAGMFYAHRKSDLNAVGGFGPSNEYLVQGRLGVQTAYWMGNGLLPYVGLAYVNDVARNYSLGMAPGRDGFVAGIGLNYFSKAGLTGGVSYSSEFGRSEAASNVLRANVNLPF